MKIATNYEIKITNLLTKKNVKLEKFLPIAEWILQRQNKRFEKLQKGGVSA